MKPDVSETVSINGDVSNWLLASLQKTTADSLYALSDTALKTVTTPVHQLPAQ